MSKAKDIYINAIRDALPGSVSETAFLQFNQAAKIWRELGQHFSAGMAMTAAVYAAWGQPAFMAEAQNASLRDFNAAVVSNSPETPAALGALVKLLSELRQTLWLFQVERRAVKSQVRLLSEELAQRLLTHFSDSEHSENYLVKGVRLSTDLDGNWTVDFPSYEVAHGVQSMGSHVTLGLPSAFHLFISVEDWQGAYEIILRHPSAFSSHGLKGWKAVVLANIDKAQAVEHFDEAADVFAQDKPPTQDELISQGGTWSGINEQLWAKYFRARARIHEAIRKPAELKNLLLKASESLHGTESGWHSGKVSRFRILINVLSKLVFDPSTMNLDEARREYHLETRISGEDEFDEYALNFITEAAGAFRGFQTDPSAEITQGRIAKALYALGQVPIIGGDLVEAIRPAVGQSALGAVLGPVRTWIHRSLQSITDEAKLRAILLRLLQSGLPRYAQVRHGPIEYGKDLVAMLERDSEVELYFYQVKCGDIDKPKWYKSKDELEEMFLVSIPILQLPSKPTRTVGILLCNGHANPYVEPVIEAWIREQRKTTGRIFEFWHLDIFINWIIENRLVNELKLALSDQRVPIVDAE